MNSEEKTTTGGCMCGAVRYETTGESFSVSPILAIGVVLLYVKDYTRATGEMQREQALKESVRQVKAKARADEWAHITRTKALSAQEELTEIRIPSDVLPGYESADRVCLAYKNRELKAVSLICSGSD